MGDECEALCGGGDDNREPEKERDWGALKSRTGPPARDERDERGGGDRDRPMGRGGLTAVPRFLGSTQAAVAVVSPPSVSSAQLKQLCCPVTTLPL